jgi:hypothetical protein
LKNSQNLHRRAIKENQDLEKEMGDVMKYVKELENRLKTVKSRSKSRSSRKSRGHSKEIKGRRATHSIRREFLEDRQHHPKEGFQSNFDKLREAENQVGYLKKKIQKM